MTGDEHELWTGRDFEILISFKSFEKDDIGVGIRNEEAIYDGTVFCMCGWEECLSVCVNRERSEKGAEIYVDVKAKKKVHPGSKLLIISGSRK